MSQILVTGEAKIRDIQGPVVANSGVITALDGAANQYVRGDGTLAIFPSSSGGGSSVSYYLNGSVNQGTFGGSTYYQMSRNAIVGTGTNFSTSSDGLIAQFITDANDPDVVSIPSGNWNVEFFMNVSASSGALASFYVEIYKYNGSTFTLLATNVATPEQLTNTTTVDAYFTSVAMPLSAMAVTDRLAVRIFANVASKTVTLYTEDNRLCQIVTTFSNGLTSLNNLTDQSQYLATGTSGTDFNIVSSGDTHTFNIPSASASNRGLITTGSQTIAGIKTLSVPSQFEQGLYLKQNMNLFQAGYIGLGASTTGLIVGLSGGGFGTLNFNNTTSFTYTFPNATGTIALTSDLSSYVPYTGATGDVNLGLFSIISNRVSAIGDNSTYGGTLSIKQNNVRSLLGTGYTELFGKTNLLGISFGVGSIANLSNSVLTAERTYTLPDLSGTLALLEGTQTFSGSKTFSTGIKAESGIFLKELSSSGRLTGYVGISATATGGMQQIQFLYPVSGSSVFSLPTTGAYNYEFPIVSGTIALTSDLSSYVPYTGATTNVDLGTNTLSAGNTKINDTLYLKLATTYTHISGYYGISVGTNIFVINNSATTQAVFGLSSLTTSRTYTLPDATGTLALTSNLSAYLPLAGGTLTGALTGTSATFSSSVTINSKTILGSDGTIKWGNSSGDAGDLTWDNDRAIIVARSGKLLALGANGSQNMYISTSGNVGIGTSSPTSKLHIYNSGVDGFTTLETTTGFSAYNRNKNGNRSWVYGIDGTSSNWIVFDETASAIRLAITSAGNVGIGTSSPQAKLQVGAFDNANALVIAADPSSPSSLYFGDGTGAALYRGFVEYSHETDTMTIGTSATTKMTITSGGNVGIGTSTIVANDGTSRTFQMGTRLAIQNVVGTQFLLSSNLYYDGAWKYMVAGKGQAIRGTGESGTIQFSLSPTGTAGGSVPNMDGSDVKMIILESGNVGIGTSSPSFPLTVGQAGSTADSYIQIGSTTTGTGNIFFGDATGGIASYSGYIQYQHSANAMLFATDSTERMRITSGGLMLLGATSSYTDYGLIQITGDNKGIAIRDSDGAYRAIYNQSGTLYFWNGSNEGYLSSAGAWVNASDVSIKKDVKEIEYGLNEVLKLKPKSYKMIDNDLAQIGFIAQEVEEILPELVDESKKGMKGLSYGQMTAVLVKAIQEQQAQIEELKELIKNK